MITSNVKLKASINTSVIQHYNILYTCAVYTLGLMAQAACAKD